jgi:hypothetical protein
MHAVASQVSRNRHRGGGVPERALWTAAGSMIVGGCAMILSSYWYRSTNDTAAAYKAYHRSRVECDLGRVKLEDTCNASRRCCLAQFGLPRTGKSAVLQAHLARIEALRPSAVPSTTAAPEIHSSRAVDVWQNFYDEAVLWVKLGKPK